MIRNAEMIDAGADLVVAYWDGKSPGTRHSIGYARSRGIKVVIINERGETQS